MRKKWAFARELFGRRKASAFGLARRNCETVLTQLPRNSSIRQNRIAMAESSVVCVRKGFKKTCTSVVVEADASPLPYLMAALSLVTVLLLLAMWRAKKKATKKSEPEPEPAPTVNRTP